MTLSASETQFLLGMAILTVLSWVAVVAIVVLEHRRNQAFTIAMTDRFMAKNYQEIAMAATSRSGDGGGVPQPEDMVARRDRQALQAALDRAAAEAERAGGIAE